MLSVDQIKKMKPEEIVALMAKMQQDQAATRKIKLSLKGSVSVYGFGRFPLSLNKSQVQWLLQDDTRKKLADCVPFLSEKDEAPEAIQAKRQAAASAGITLAVEKLDS